MTVRDRLDGFVPFLLSRVEYARRNGIPKFTATHANGDRMVVRFLPFGQIEVVREKPTIDGKEVKDLRIRLVTTEAELRADLAEGIRSNQAEVYRG